MLLKTFLSVFALAAAAHALAVDGQKQDDNEHGHHNVNSTQAHKSGAEAPHKAVTGKPVKANSKHHDPNDHKYGVGNKGLPHYDGHHWISDDHKKGYKQDHKQDHDDGHHKRDVIYTKGANDTGDSRWHVSAWTSTNCTGSATSMYDDYIFMSSHCMRAPTRWKSFSLQGNVKDCATFWYRNTDCSGVADWSSVMGDIQCVSDVTGSGVGSFRITCDGSNGGA